MNNDLCVKMPEGILNIRVGGRIKFGETGKETV